MGDLQAERKIIIIAVTMIMMMVVVIKATTIIIIFPRWNQVIHEKTLVKKSNVFSGEKSCWLLLPASWDTWSKPPPAGCTK